VVTNPNATPVAQRRRARVSERPAFWTRTSRRMRAAYTDQDGRFRVSGLPPGEYMAVAAPSVDESDLGRPSRWKRCGRSRCPSLSAQTMPRRP
jgi:hypothetical protein